MSGESHGELLASAKKILWQSGTEFDREIQDLIDAAYLDMETSGIDTSVNEALIKQAVMTYVKANFGIENPDADRLMESYQKQVNKLAISQPAREVSEE